MGPIYDTDQLNRRFNRMTRFLALLGGAFAFFLLLAACTATTSPTSGVETKRAEQSLDKPSQEKRGVVYFAGLDQLKLYSKPSFSKEVVGNLKLHAKVYRYKLQRGFAYVKVDTTGQIGWVENAKLIWRLPPAMKKSAPIEEPTEGLPNTAGPKSKEAVASPPSQPAVEPSPRTIPSGSDRRAINPSVFDRR